MHACAMMQSPAHAPPLEKGRGSEITWSPYCWNLGRLRLPIPTPNGKHMRESGMVPQHQIIRNNVRPHAEFSSGGNYAELQS
jgi:hypothetical protein